MYAVRILVRLLTKLHCSTLGLIEQYTENKTVHDICLPAVFMRGNGYLYLLVHFAPNTIPSSCGLFFLFPEIPPLSNHIFLSLTVDSPMLEFLNNL